MSKMLIVVDPQVDFITGALPVPGAREAMDGLARWLTGAGGRYSAIVITADWHPWNHFSFADNGGRWPRHCVHDTVGAAVWPSVFEAAYGLMSEQTPVVLLHKGMERDVEEYSVFDNPANAGAITSLAARCGIDQVEICGLAGDVCVLSTLRGALAALTDCRIAVLERFAPSLDGGNLLRQISAERPDVSFID